MFGYDRVEFVTNIEKLVLASVESVVFFATAILLVFSVVFFAHVFAVIIVVTVVKAVAVVLLVVAAVASLRGGRFCFVQFSSPKCQANPPNRPPPRILVAAPMIAASDLNRRRASNANISMRRSRASSSRTHRRMPASTIAIRFPFATRTPPFPPMPHPSSPSPRIPPLPTQC